MAYRVVGIDLGHYRLRLVVMSVGFRGVQGVRLIEVPVENPSADLSAMIDAALAALREHNLMGLPLGVALPGSLGSYRLLRFPFTDPRRIVQAVAFEAEGQFPLPLELLEFDQVTSATGTGEGQALVVAVERRHVETVVSRITDAGGELKVLTVSPIALAQAIGGPVPPIEGAAADDTRRPVALVLDVGHRSTHVIAVTDKVPVVARCVRRGGRAVSRALMEAYGFDERSAENAKHQDAFLAHSGLEDMSEDQRYSAGVVANAMEAIVRELEHTRLWLRTTHGYEATQVRLAGGGVLLNGLASYLQEQVGLPVTFIQPRVLREAGGSWTTGSVALGAAAACARRPLIQLHDFVSKSSEDSWLQQRLGTLAGIGMAILGFGAIDTVSQIDALESMEQAYREELSVATMSAFGEALDSPNDIEVRLADVTGEDLTTLVPTRGALDVLAMITTATTPIAVDPAAAPAVPAVDPASPTAAPTGTGTGTGTGTETGSAADQARGILGEDDLILEVVEIRERKIELKVSAMRSSAQDRFALKLQETGCLQNVQKGKVRDENERKVFEMSMDNGCFTQQSGAAALTQEDG